jgi:IstB-like ATP binding protein
MNDLGSQLAAIGLRHTAAHLDDVVANATKRRLGPLQLLELVVENEQKERTRRSLERRVARSRLGRIKPMSDYDWAWPRRIDRDAVEQALALGFLEGARNIVLVAPQGLGKTMIAQNISTRRCLPATSRSSSPRRSSCSTSARKTRRAPSIAGCATTRRCRCSSSTRSVTSPTTAATPTCFSRSSAVATRSAASCSPPICPSASGPPSSRTPPAPPPSSTASSTTPRSSPSRATATADEKLRPQSRQRSPSPSRDRHGQISALLGDCQQTGAATTRAPHE